MKVLVLRGGPDREREVSLLSGANVAGALREAGHEVVEADVGPGALEAIHGFAGDAVFPVLHGKWGEGGPLQEVLEARGVGYVGCGPDAARRCMDKAETKRRLDRAGLHTPAWGVVSPGQPAPLDPPVVVKALDEGSSFAMAICRTDGELQDARQRLAEHDPLLIERFVAGRELTVGVLGAGIFGDCTEEDSRHPAAAMRPLPTLEILPAEGFYDFEAKYRREDTRYRFDLDLPGATLEAIQRAAVRAAEVLGVRDLGRVDFLVDADDRPWILEINTMPGFTSHSLLPMAAAKAGVDLPTLCDRLVRQAARRRSQ
jgi:D-alanine-D-alanine ligase